MTRFAYVQYALPCNEELLAMLAALTWIKMQG